MNFKLKLEVDINTEFIGRKIKIKGKYLNLTPWVKQEDKKNKDPKPNQRLDFATSLHITRSHITCPIRSRLP